ncbi:MAG: DUF3857 domain-containing transglutaminase family protein [Proteobacteria bacterium]|nr:DUF3857 domain-containing transglutaminase family protein [Pseudomonadota bacterium]
MHGRGRIHRRAIAASAAIGLASWLALGGLAARASDTPSYQVAPVPDWVRPVEPGVSSAKVVEGRPVDYRLVDQQIRVDGTAAGYFRYVARALSSVGVERLSQVSLNFDPDHDRLTVHRIVVRRGATTIDELEHGKIEVLHRESELEQGLLDGALTFHLVMSDVRVGDEIDVAFTIEHRFPDWGDRPFGRASRHWEDPCARAHLRILSRASMPLAIRDPDGELPKPRREGDFEVREWQREAVPATLPEDDVPSWFEQYPRLEYAAFRDWGEVAAAALPLYELPEPLPEEVRTLAQKLTAGAVDPAAKALTIVRFVQQEIRYTGIELGTGAFRPTAPAAVLARRYGDCKDKTLLAVALLRSAGLEATPALVSTVWRAHLGERLPGPQAFNHVIVRTWLGGAEHWFDVTATEQGGTLERFVESGIGAALLVAPGTTALSTWTRPEPREPLIEVRETFDLRAGLEKETGYEVVTRYRGYEANSMRRQLKHATPAEVGKHYLEFYQRRYPALASAGDPVVEDDFAANVVTVRERYRLPQAFEADDSGKRVFELEGSIVSPYLRAPKSVDRRAPIWLGYPTRVEEQVLIRLPEDFPISDGRAVVEGPAFHFERQVSHAGNDVTLNYHFELSREDLAPDSVAELARRRGDARGHTSFQFSYRPGAASATPAENAERALSDALAAKQAGKDAEAAKRLGVALDPAAFATLPPNSQRNARWLAASLAGSRGDWPAALAELRRATAAGDESFDLWSFRVHAAIAAADAADAAESLTHLAQHWPANLAKVDDWVPPRVVREAPHAGTARFDLLRALYAAKYRRSFREPSGFWVELATLALERGDRGLAVDALHRVDDPYALVAIAADRRFDEVRSRLGDLPSSAAASRRGAELGARAIAEHPSAADAVVDAAHAYLVAGQPTEALAVCDAAIARVHGSHGTQAFDDYGKRYVWVLDLRSRALERLGRWDEALAQEVEASHLTERGMPNVSQAINLAARYNELGRAKEARAALAAVGRDLSSFGRTQLEAERLLSAVQLGDGAETERALGYLKEHAEDSWSTYQSGLLAAGRTDEAAALLIARLRDPERRLDALVAVQGYADVPRGPFGAELARREAALIAREDVQQAITAVGRIDRYLLPPESR